MMDYRRQELRHDRVDVCLEVPTRPLIRDDEKNVVSGIAGMSLLVKPIEEYNPSLSSTCLPSRSQHNGNTAEPVIHMQWLSIRRSHRNSPLQPSCAGTEVIIATFRLEASRCARAGEELVWTLGYSACEEHE